MRWPVWLVALGLVGLLGCATAPVPPVEVAREAAGLSPAQAGFWANLHQLCGARLEGRELFSAAGRDRWAERAMHLDFAHCDDREIRVPFRVDEDTSRTWLLQVEGARLRLRHQHLEADGTPEAHNLYGGYADPEGSAWMQHFPADAYTEEHLGDGLARVWTLSLSEDLRTLRYGLRYAGDLVFEAAFTVVPSR